MRLLSLAFALLAFALPARAAEFELSPTRVRLDARHLVDTVQVGNSGASPLGFEVTVARWRMDADGAWQLEPSDDLVVHPLLLEIAPGSKARLRVGLLVPPTDPGEAAYRIELHEQPSAGAATSGSGVRMLTRISLPVFVSGGDAVAGVVDADIQQQGFGLRGRLRRESLRGHWPGQQHAERERQPGVHGAQCRGCSGRRRSVTVSSRRRASCVARAHSAAAACTRSGRLAPAST